MKKLRASTMKKITSALIELNSMNIIISKEQVRRVSKVDHRTIANRWDAILFINSSLQLTTYYSSTIDLCKQVYRELTNTKIINWYSTSKNNNNNIRKRLLSLGYSSNPVTGRFELTEVHTGSKLLSYFITIALYDMKTLRLKSRKKYLEYSHHLAQIYMAAMSNEGHYVSSQHPSLRWMYRNDAKFDVIGLFFSREGVPSKSRGEAFKYIPQPIIITVVETAIKKFSAMEFDSIRNEYGLGDNIFNFPLDKIGSIRLLDAVTILDKCIVYSDGDLICPIYETDNSEFRALSWFQRLSSSTRAIVYKYSADVNSLSSTVRLNLLNSPKKYPQHIRSVIDKANMRREYSRALGQSLDGIKKTLNRADNRLNPLSLMINNPVTAKYATEAPALIDEVARYVRRNDKMVFDKCMVKARKQFRKVYTGVDKYEIVETSKAQLPSLISYITTYYERVIIEAMRSTKPSFIPQVFDCVYSKTPFDRAAIDKAISIKYNQTSVSVTISYEA